MEEPLLLNLGCGDHYVDGWVNVDMTKNEHVHPDVVAPITDLPFERETVDAIYMGHVLEHLDWDSDLFVAMKEARRVLKTDAPLLVVGPDVGRARQLVAMGVYPVDLLPAVIDGGNRWEGDDHKWACSEAKLIRLLKEHDFRGVDSTPVQKISDIWPVASYVGWQAAVVGVR